MMGNDMNPGIIRLSMQTIFDYIKENTTELRQFLIRVSYLEIYNEKVFDLLSKDMKTINIFVDKNKNISFDNLKEEVVRDVDEVMEIIKKGESFRTVAKTFANDTSSRSHTVFRMVIERKDDIPIDETSNRVKTVVRIGHLNLVDLAGSENASKHDSNDRAREGKNINLSLLHLKEIIVKLSKGKKVESFRNSKLTRILGQSLDGNAKVAVICAINPLVENYAESKQTLHFGNCAGMISVAPTINSDGTNAMIIKYQEEISAMQFEIKSLKERLSQYDREITINSASTQDINRVRNERRSVRLELGELQQNMEEMNKFIISNESLEARLRDFELQSQLKENRLKEFEEENLLLEQKLRNEEIEKKRALELRDKEAEEKIREIQLRDLEVNQERGQKQELQSELASMNENIGVMYQLLQQDYQALEKRREREVQEMNETIAKLYQTLITKDDEIRRLIRESNAQKEHTELQDLRYAQLEKRIEKMQNSQREVPRKPKQNLQGVLYDDAPGVRSERSRRAQYDEEEADNYEDRRPSRKNSAGRNDVADYYDY
jgi:centromeric protein E